MEQCEVGEWSSLGKRERKQTCSYHRVQLPQTSPIAWFHPNTATGKLNAVMIPTSPRGFHVSSNTWPGPAGGRGEGKNSGVSWGMVLERLVW